MEISVVMGVLVALLAGLSALAIVVAVTALRLVRRSQRRSRETPLPYDVEGLRGEVAALKAEVADALRHLAVVRYDAFGDMGGHLSWSLALLDDGGNGVVVTSIHGRSDARTYAKNVTGWACEQQISPEEHEAISMAKAS